MKQMKLSENITIRRISNKGGISRTTTCPYCDAKIGLELSTMSKHPFCGHVDKLWEADSRWYIKFNQYKQVGDKIMGRLLSKEETQGFVVNNFRTEDEFIEVIATAQLAKTDKEWVEKLNSSYRICNSGMCGYRTDKCQMLRIDDGEMGEFSCAWWQAHKRSIGL